MEKSSCGNLWKKNSGQIWYNITVYTYKKKKM